MPITIRGPLQIYNVTTNGLVKFGDSLVVSPKTEGKGYLGSGGGNTGEAVIINTGVSATNYIGPNVTDQPNGKNK